MAENKKIPNNLNMNKQGELKNHARGSSPSFDPRQNQNKQKNGSKGVNGNPEAMMKKKLLTEGIKKGAQAYGVPEQATEQILQSETGQAALDAAAGAPSIGEGAKEAVKVIAEREIYPKILIGTLVPFLIIILFFVIIFGKDSFGGLGDATDIYEDLRDEIMNVAGKYSTKADIDGNLILATLVAYNDLEDVEDEEKFAKNMAYMKKQVETLVKYQIMTTTYCTYESSTMRQIASNDDGLTDNEANYNCITDPNAVPSYSVETAEGNINNDNSGSVYYWNLIDEGFIFNYYNDYMVNKNDQNSSENTEIIGDIVAEIYDYYNMMEKLNFKTYASLCSSGITVDGVTMEFEEYIKGVLNSELGYNDVPLEALKALALAARSVAISSTNNCVAEMDNSTVTQTFKEYDKNIDNPLIEQAVTETKGEYMRHNNQVYVTSHSYFPSIDNENCPVTCDDNNCSVELWYDSDKTLGTYNLTIPKNVLFDGKNVEWYSENTKGRCYGLSKLGAWYDAKNGMNYEDIIKKYYLPDIEIAVMGGEGLVADSNGYLMRVSRPTRENSFFYRQDSTNYGTYLEGECAWYATARAQEILDTMNIGVNWTFNGNGQQFCQAVNYDKNKFEVSYNYKEARPGAIIGWYDGGFGHVAIVERVEGDLVTITEAGLSKGPTYTVNGCGTGSCVRSVLSIGGFTAQERLQYCESDGSGCFDESTVSLQRLKNYYGLQFQCYIYLTQPK